MELTRRITIEREPDSDMVKYEPVIIELEESEVLTVKQLKHRLRDELNITPDMVMLVNGEMVDESVVLEDEDRVYAKAGMGDKG